MVLFKFYLDHMLLEILRYHQKVAIIIQGLLKTLKTLINLTGVSHLLPHLQFRKRSDFPHLITKDHTRTFIELIFLLCRWVRKKENPDNLMQIVETKVRSSHL